MSSMLYVDCKGVDRFVAEPGNALIREVWDLVVTPGSYDLLVYMNYAHGDKLPRLNSSKMIWTQPMLLASVMACYRSIHRRKSVTSNSTLLKWNWSMAQHAL
jgi:hypothetical protein